MNKGLIAFAVAGALAASPCAAADLPDEDFRPVVRSGSVAGLYYKLPLDAPRGAERAPRAGLRMAMTQGHHEARFFAAAGSADILDLRLAGTGPAAFHVAGRPVTGPKAERLAAAGGEGGRLDKIMIGAGIALAAAAGFVIFSSVD